MMRRGEWMLCACLLAVAAGVWGAETGPGPDLAAGQERLRARMEELERRVLEVAELVREERPEVAARLEAALAESRRRLIVAQMGTVRSLLAQEDYGAAMEREQRVLDDLAAFVALLEPVRTAENLELMRRAAERLAALAERQGRAADATRAAADGAGAYGDLATEQAAIRAEGAALLEYLAGAAGSDSLQAALAGMAAAEAALLRGEKAGALGDQLAAAEQLAAALAQLKEAIRRLEEGDAETIRSRLRAHLAAMLEAQTALREDTLGLHAARAPGEGEDRAHRLAAARLGNRQGAIASSAGDAAALVQRGGGSRAMSIALSGFTGDAKACAALLAGGVTGPPVTDSQRDLEAVLRSLLGALSGQLGAPEDTGMPEGKEGERKEPQSLLGIHAELGVLADLQLTLKARTARVEEARGPAGDVPAWAAAEGERIGRSQSAITGALRRIDQSLREAGL